MEVEPVFKMWIFIVNVVTNEGQMNSLICCAVYSFWEMFSCTVYGFVCLHTPMMQ